MSVCYHIGCKDCKKSLWIAQSTRCFYSGEPHTMKALKEFLFDHHGHPLVFSDSHSFDDYEEIDADKYKE